MKRRRRALWIALGGVAVSLGVLWLLRSGDAASRSTAPDVAAAAPAAPVRAAPAAAPPRRPIAETPLAELPEPIRRFLESTPYPPTSGRLTAAHEDLLHPNARYERPRPIPDTVGDDPNGVVTWLFTADHWAYVGPATVHAWLEVRRAGKPVEATVVSASAIRENADGSVGTPEPLRFEREGDRLVTELPLARLADHFGTIALDVRFEYERGHFHEDRLRILSIPANHVPGQVVEISDRVSNGSLVLDVGADLSVGGFYRFDANVYDAAGNPVAFAAFKGELAAGHQQIPLMVWGKVLQDAGIPGPYTIGEIRGYRFLDGQYPDRELLPAVEGTHTTAAWPLDLFTNASYVDEQELQMAELMLDDVEAGRPIFEPPAANDPVTTRPADDDAEPPVAQ